jgi:peptide/nickel transport system ATP-binding protein
VQLLGQELGAQSRRAQRPLRRRMQMIFQDPFASLNPRLSVGEIIGEGMSALGFDATGQGNGAIAAVLEQVGLAPEAPGAIRTSSPAGQRQRIAIARALAVQPDLVICDEPTSALDVSVQAQILNLLATLQADLGLAYLFITHNFAVVDHLAHEVAVMYLGRIVERGRSMRSCVRRSTPTPAPCCRPCRARVWMRSRSSFTCRVRCRRRPRPPTGCHFHPRCRQASAVCRERYPETTAVSTTHAVNCHLYR